MKTVVDLKTWDRYELYKHFDACTNPFVIITSDVDVTKLYNYVKKNRLSIYASMGFMIAKTARTFEGFRYRKEEDSIVLFDDIVPNFTDSDNGKNIYFYDVEYQDDINKFNVDYHDIKERIKNHEYVDNTDYKINNIWLSCTPWFSFNSLIPPFNRENTIPQFIWDRFKEKDGKITTNLMVMIHHGFMDGYQIGAFYKKLEDNINSIEGDV